MTSKEHRPIFFFLLFQLIATFKKTTMKNYFLGFITLGLLFGCGKSEVSTQKQIPSPSSPHITTQNQTINHQSSNRQIAFFENTQASKTYADFLTAIRTFESTIDPKKAEYYTENYNNPSAITYQQVEYPGRVIRDINGNPKVSTTSIKEYFKKLGIDHLYQEGTTDPKVFYRMQYATINFLGFVGYQFSEQDVWALGYYTHYNFTYPEVYSDLPNSVWANGVRGVWRKIPDFGLSLVTDVNTWTGTWTGKHGIHSFEDFMDPEKQDFIAKDHFTYKYNRIVKALEAQGKTIDQYIGTKLYWNECVPPISPPPGGRSNEVVITMSGLLAGAHLRGAAGVEDLLVNHKNHSDEIGTTILQYVQDFGGYQTPFKN